MADLDFVHLHVHSSYSLLEGALTIARLAELAKADHQPALALTDTDNMFGALEFSEKLAGSGIQPIVGCALAIDFGDTDHGPRNANAQPERTRIVLLAAREAGYRSLMRLSFARLPRYAAERAAAAQARMARGRDRRASSRSPAAPAGRSMRAIAAGQSHLAASRLDALLRTVRRPALCRTAAPRHAGRARDRAGADRSRLRQGHSAGRDQRAVFRRPRKITRRTTR